jgi:hypothetical protein
MSLRFAAVAGVLATSSCVTAPAEHAPYAPVTIPFERGRQGHIVLPVTVNGVTGYAVLDNGASVSVLNRDFAVEQKLAHGAVVRTMIKTMTSGFELGQPAEIAVGGIGERVMPLLLDLDPLSAVSGKELLGIVGEEFFERHVVEVDFSNKTLRLHHRENFVPPADLPVIPLKSRTTAKTRIPATVEGEDGHEITFDLGSSAHALIDSGGLADRMMADGRPSIPSASGIVVKGQFERAEGRSMSAKEISFAGFTLTDIPIDVTQEGFVAPSDLSLGVAALSRFDLIFDVGGKRMWMRPNEGYGQPFPHPVVGLSFRMNPDGGGLGISAVAPGSPAERAGLNKGDVIVRVGGDRATLAAFADVEEGRELEVELKDGSKLTIKAARFF